jgi:hypothetical protein
MARGDVVKLRLALVALAAAGWLVAGVLFWVLPTEDEWDAEYERGYDAGEDSHAMRAGA